jgi:hypothetical protein
MMVQIDQNRVGWHYGPPEVALPSVAVTGPQQGVNN